MNVIKTKNTNKNDALSWQKKLLVFILAFFILGILISIPITMINIIMGTGLRFSPTMEEAFSRHSSGRRDMGEIYFIDDHRYNLTVFHVIEGQSGRRTRFVSHYIRELQDGVWVYLCVGVNISNFVLNSNEASISRNVVFIESLLIPINRTHERFLLNHPFNRRLNRWPLYGFSNCSNIHNLVINGQSPNYIIEADINSPVELMYFWYFSNFIFNEGDRISISFGE